MSSETLRLRSEIPEKYRWDVESIFPDADACRAEITALREELPNLIPVRSSVIESPDGLKVAFEVIERLRQRAYVVIAYASLRNAEDRGEQTYNALRGQALSLVGELYGATSFLEPAILELGEDTVNGWVSEHPELEVYRQFVDDLFRQQQHVCTEEVEALLGQVEDPFNGMVGVIEALREADLKVTPAQDAQGRTLAVSEATLDGILAGSDRPARKSAWENFADAHLAFKNTLAAGLITSVKQNVFRARARHYPSSLESSLFNENIPETVYRTLLDVFKASLPVWQRYWRVRREALSLETIHTYDIWCPLTDARPRQTFEGCVDLISEAVAPLGEDYVATMRKGCLENRWVDVYPNQGKAGGAFSGGAPGHHPFILMNFHEDVSGLSTLAHELGHSMSNHSIWARQPSIYAHPYRFSVEIPSNTHQMLLRDHLMKTVTDRALRIAALEEAMEHYHRYMFLMPTLACFELEVHERVERGMSPGADDLNGILADLFAQGYGSEMVLDPQRNGIAWAQFPHLYMAFYVYQYVVGIAGARAISRGLIERRPGVQEAYKRFISSGRSRYPLDSLREVGVDFTSPAVFEDAFTLISETIDLLEVEVAAYKKA